jgi:hypothetical protein
MTKSCELRFTASNDFSVGTSMTTRQILLNWPHFFRLSHQVHFVDRCVCVEAVYAS